MRFHAFHLVGFLGMALVAFAANAQTPASTPAPEGGIAVESQLAQQATASSFIQDLGDRALGVITNAGLSEEQKNSQYRDILRDAFDLQTIGRFVIGRNWQVATPEQQTEYMKLFEELILKTYGDKLEFYKGEGFAVSGQRPEGERDFVVNSKINHPNKPPTDVDWRVRNKDGKFMILDVIVEGTSLSITQRDEYAAIVQRDGGKIDGLLERMRARIQQS